jgi:uncharacterized NAD(P)/FAD-binding protein YdhS
LRRIAIIGGGYSGVAAAIQLVNASKQPLDIRVVEPRATLGAGLAHSTPHPDHRLNAPEAIHSLHPDDVGHFGAWLDASGTLLHDPGSRADNGYVFARRADFGRYVASELERHARSNTSASRIDHVRAVAVDAHCKSSGIEVTLESGATLGADACILATGWNAVSVPRQLESIAGHPGWVGNVWDLDRMSAIPRHATVLMLGAGLTAADAFATLAAQGHQGPVFALSRHGLRPASQNPHRGTATIWERLLDPSPAFVRRHGLPGGVGTALHALRQDIAAVDAANSSWHVVFDEMRDALSHFWPALPPAEKQRFVRHLKSWYDAHRFRNPPQTEQIVTAGERRGQLEFISGRIALARMSGPQIAIEYQCRATGARRIVQAAAVVNCTGPQPRPSASSNPLFQSLLRHGAIRDNPCGLGLDVDDRSRTLDARGSPSDALFAIGPPTTGHLGETTAVPFITRQILDVVAQLGSDGGSSDVIG